jgi:branched-chain amino acid transport system ATP-binding protein
VSQPPIGQTPDPTPGAHIADSSPPRPAPAFDSSVSTLLKLQGVNTHIGAYHILHGVDVDVPPGQVTMLLGRNGAGKTTTLRTIMGLWAASKGTITFDGAQIGGPAVDPRTSPRARLGTPDIVRLGIAYVPENMGIFADLSVSENMLLAARDARTMSQLDTARLEWLFELFPALRKFWLYPAGKLSGGQKQMLAIARAMVEPRRLLLIDEPSKGLAPAIVQNLIAALRELKRSETTVLLVEQNFAMARALGDRVAVMDDGRVVHSGDMAELAEDEGLQHRLLGLSLAAHQ